MTRPRVTRFNAWIAIITAVGLVIRMAYVHAHAHNRLGGDAFVYHNGAILLVRGKGFIAPLQYGVGRVVQSAYHPPLYTLFLAIPSALGLQTVLEHLIWSALLGTSTIVVAGFLGRRVANERAGLITAAIVAVTPNIWLYDGDVLSETLAIFITTVALLLAYRAWERPSLGRIVALGAACGLAALTRSELILLLPALVLPVAILATRHAPREQWARVGAGTAAVLVVIAPWVGYNLTRFNHPVFLSSQFEATLAASNCDDTYSGSAMGALTSTCMYGTDAYADQSDQATLLRHRAWKFITTHKSRVPIVVAARVGRVTGLFRPRQQINEDVFLEGRERILAQFGLMNTYLVEVGAIAGFFLWRRRQIPRFPLVALPAITLFTVALTYGTNRFRASAEVSLAVLTAVAIDALWTGLSRRRGSLAEPAPE